MAVETLPFDAANYLDTAEDVAGYLDALFEDGTPEEISRALATVARSKGASGIARKAKISRETIYKSFNQGGDPRLSTVLAVLNAFGVKLRVEPVRHASTSAATLLVRNAAASYAFSSHAGMTVLSAGHLTHLTHVCNGRLVEIHTDCIGGAHGKTSSFYPITGVFSSQKEAVAAARKAVACPAAPSTEGFYGLAIFENASERHNG